MSRINSVNHDKVDKTFEQWNNHLSKNYGLKIDKNMVVLFKDDLDFHNVSKIENFRLMDESGHVYDVQEVNIFGDHFISGFYLGCEPCPIKEDLNDHLDNLKNIVQFAKDNGYDELCYFGNNISNDIIVKMRKQDEMKVFKFITSPDDQKKEAPKVLWKPLNKE